MPVTHEATETLSFDLVVIGGGLAGVCAAVAAARAGAKVAIVQERPVFGGNSSSEVRVVPYGSSHSSAWTNETGISHEIILEDRAGNHEAFFDHGLINTHYDMVLHETLRREPNISIYLNTSVRGVDSEAIDPSEQATPTPTENGLGRVGGERRRITAVHASQLGSEREFRFTATQFIDATGDGTVGFLAGADFRYGRESRAEFNENLAPLVADDVTMGSTITMRARDIGRPVPFDPPPWIEQYPTLESIGVNRELYHITKPQYGGYWWLEVCNPFHQVQDNAAIRDELHRHVLGVWNYIKNHSDIREKARTYALDWVGMVPGKRESRRLMGDVVVTEHDCHADRNWPDGVAYAGWWIDLHIPGGILNKEEPGERENVDKHYKHWIRVPPFSLPLRAMYSRNVENLWMAGRCYSLTHVALGPVRVQLTLGLQGQAVGSAAAYALRHDLTPRQTADPEGPHVARVRQNLLREDVHLLGLRSEDEDDLALAARATASSEAPFDLGEPNTERWVALNVDRAMIVPLTHDRLNTASFHLRNDTAASVNVLAEVHEMNRIWDRDAGRTVASTTIEVPPGSSWVEAKFDAKVTPDRPYRLVLRAAEGVHWAEAGPLPVGTVRQFLHVNPGGIEEKHRHLPSFKPDAIDIPAYKHWWQMRRVAMACRVSPNPHPFAASSVNNGVAWPESMPNVWISDPAQPLPQWVQLDWPRPVRLNTARISFDTQLDLTTGHRPELWRAPQCARDWELRALVDGQWRTVHRETGNYQRRRTARFDPVVASAVRLVVTATNGDASARVYEITLHDEPNPEEPRTE